jgi:hypothetical protein
LIDSRLCEPRSVLQSSFGLVVFIVVGVCAVVALIAFAGSGKVYEQIGKGLFSLRDGTDRPANEPTGAAASAEREAEIRQLLAARNERRIRRGEPPLDIDAELRALMSPAIDPGLEAEIRGLVIARNERRAKRGEPPLDVEAEVARQLSELA